MTPVNVPPPPLEPHCGSWILTNRRTGSVVEVFGRETAQKAANTGLYQVETAAQYLVRLNRATAQ